MAEDTLNFIAANIDSRRLELTRLRRIVLHHASSTLESTVVRMSIPMLYALWEGFVKESCQAYIEHVEVEVATAESLKPAILGYLWTPELRKLSGGVGFDKKHNIARLALTGLKKPVRFGEAERAVDTKSNLDFQVLEEIARHLCLDTASLQGERKHLDALVNLRNSIAHGAKPTGMEVSDFEQHASTVVHFMEQFEEVLRRAMHNRSFCATA
jgi:hypothetical protein